MTLKKNILNVFLVIMMVLCLTSCKSSKLMIEEININQLEQLIENKEDFILKNYVHDSIKIELMKKWL